MSTETNILLPTSRVDIFIKDRETLEAARKLSDDWRFARVNISVEEGDVELALKSYEETSSPDLIIIESDTTDDSFINRLESLSAYCEKNTNAIVVGPDNDVNLYRSLTAMGVRDYLVKPVPLETLSEIIAAALIAQLGISGSRLIGVMGAKGGVGTSSLTQGLAWGLSEKLDQKTFLLDAAGGWSSMSVGMGYEPATTMHEAVLAAANHDQDSLNRMLHKANKRLTILATGLDGMLDSTVEEQQFEELIDMAMQSYPVVVVDLSGALPLLKKTIVTKAHELVVVTTPTLSSLRSARTLMNEIKMLHGNDDSQIDLLVNMAGMIASKEVPKKDIEAALEHAPHAIIPFDAKLFIGNENEGKKLTNDKSGMEIVSTLLPLAQKVLADKSATLEEEKTGFLDNLLGKMSKRA